MWHEELYDYYEEQLLSTEDLLNLIDSMEDDYIEEDYCTILDLI